MLPADGSPVEMTAHGVVLTEVRVVRTVDQVLTLSLALADVPPAGSPVTLRWSAAPRGRYALPGVVVAVDENRVDIQTLGEPSLEQARNYVRGGGGEVIVMLRPGHADATGYVHDISERSVRAHFTDVELRPGHDMVLRVHLGDDVVEFKATAAKVSSIRQQLPHRGPMSVEMVAIFDRDERQAKTVRRYVLRHQSQSRARASALV